MPSRRWASGGSGYDGVFGDSFFSDCWDTMDINRRRRIVHEDVTADVPEERIKPWFRKTNLSRISDDDIYQVMLEVSNFTPSELRVKLVNDKTVIVEGKHGERPDVDGFVSREFTRKYNLPESVLPSTVECYLSKDGVLVIRGHAPRQGGKSHAINGNTSRAGATMEREVHEQHKNLIPIFTSGYHTRHSSGNSNASNNSNGNHKERIIPISQESGSTKPQNTSNLSSAANNNKNETKIEVQELFSGRSSRNSDREARTASPIRPNKFVINLENGGNNGRSRTVSFNDDDDTIASNSPIIEEPASTSSNGPTPEPLQPSSSSSKRIPPPLSRQNKVEESSFSQYRSSSRMSEEREQSPRIPIVTSPVGGGSSSLSSTYNKKANGNHVQTITVDLDDNLSSSSDRELFRRDHHGHLDHHLDLLRSRSPLEDFDKLHKEIIERHRHISRESLDRIQRESDKLLQTARTRSPLFSTHSSRIQNHDDDDIFDSALKKFDRPLLGKWDSDKWETSKLSNLVPKSNEEQYEKKFEKGFDKNGNYTQRLEEKMFSQKYSSTNNNSEGNKYHKSLDHPFNISSPA